MKTGVSFPVNLVIAFDTILPKILGMTLVNKLDSLPDVILPE